MSTSRGAGHRDVLLMQSNKEPVCAEFPGDLLKKKGNVHSTTGPLPEPIENIQGICAVSTMNKGKKELCNLNLVCEAVDHHQQILNHCRENPSSAQDSSTTAGSEEAIKPAEENSKILYLASYSSGPKSLEKCVFESNALVKESAEKIQEVDQSKNFSCGVESKEQNQRPSSERGGLLFSVTEQEQNGSGEKQTVESSNHTNYCTQASSCAEICSSMPNSFTEATEIMFQKNDLKMTLNFQGNLVYSEDHRKTVTYVNHPERHSEESGFPLLVHVEEPEQNSVNSSALTEKIYGKDSKSVVSAQRNLGDSLPTKASCIEFLSGRKSPQSLIPADPVNSEHNEISKPKKSPAKLPPRPEFVCGPASEKHVQDLHDNIAHLDEPIIACEICELSCNSELVEHECVLNQQVSLNSQEHVTLPTDSLLNLNREMPSATCRDAQQSCHSLKNRANLITNTQTIPAETKLEVTSAQGDRTRGASPCTHTLNHTISPEGQKEMTESGIKDLHSTFLSSVKETAGFSFVTECQNVQSQDISSCQCITRNASEENICSACAALGPRKDALKASNCKVNCGNAQQSSRHCFQTSEYLVENSTFLESVPAGRKTQSSVLGGKVRSEMATGVSGSRVLLNTTTPATSHVEPSEEGLGGRKQGRHRCTAVYSHMYPCDTQELSQSTNIPNPDTLADQSLNVISSRFKAMYQAAQSLDQKAEEVSDCQRNQNSPDKCRSEGKPAQEGLSGDPRETVPEVNHKEKDLLVTSGSENPVLCGSLEKSDSRGAFENIPGSEALVYSVLDVVCPDCTGEPAEAVLDADTSSPAGHSTRRDRLAYHESLRSTAPLRGELNVVFIGTTDQDSGLSSAAASTVNCPEILKSREETICRFLKDYEMEECPDSATDHEVECVTDQEPNVRALDKRGVSLNYIHCENQGKGKSVTEGLRIEADSEFGEKKTFGLSSKDSKSSRCQGSVEMAQSCLSSQEHSPAGVLGEKPKLKHLFKPKDGEILHENTKNCTVQSDMKEGIPTNIGNTSKGDGTYVSVDTNVCKACHSHENSIDKHLPLIMVTAIKQNKEETEEHQKGPLGHLPVGEGSEETITRDSHVNFPKSYQIHLKCQSVQDVAKSLQSWRVVERVMPKDENLYQKGMCAQLKQHTSVNMLSDEMQSKKPMTVQSESIIMEEVTLRKPTKKKMAGQLQRLEDPEQESLCHLLKKGTGLCTGPRLPGTSWKKPDPSAAGDGQIHGAFMTLSHQQRLLPIKKQPHRTCKRISCPELVTLQRKVTKVRNSDCGKSSSNLIPTKTHRLLSPCAVPAAPLEPEAVPSKSLCSHIPKPKATLCHPLSPSCRKPTKESALLNKLSVLASKLVLATKPQKLRYQRYSSSLVPLAKSYKRLRYKKLLDGFAYNAMQLDPCLAATGWDRRSNSKPLALYSLEAVKMSFIDLSNKMPSLLFGTKIFPFSFHVKSASSCMVESSRTFPEHCAPSRLALAETSPCSSPPPKWTFSFFMSRCSGMATFREDTGLYSQTHTQAPPQTTAPLQDYGGTAIVQTGANCSVLGLHTLLALCSPGCYRIWTKRRSFTNHMPIMQRLFLTQFTQGLKGLRSPASLADKAFCSLPYSVGRVLSIWSQHGPSYTFQLPALHSTHSKQQGSLSILSSHNTTPNVPLPGMGAVHSTNSSHLRLEPVFPALVPKACLVTEPAVSKLLLSASEFQVPGFDELGDVSAACPRPQSSPAEQKEAEPEKRPKKVSQIRIRKTIPKPDPNLTPMGLPRPKRLKKKEFSLEEIYTNKNYKSPPANRCLETIFEEPKERNGTLVSISQQKRKRVLEFQDFTLPRKRRARGKVKLVGSFTRAQKAALQTRELDELLIQKLLELETFFAKEEELEQSVSP